MNVSSLQELKEELPTLPPKKLAELCISLAKYKKDNKEFLGYLLFQAHDRDGFILQVKEEADQHFAEIREQKNLYYVKKSLRKVLRILNKYCKYMGDKAATAEVLLYFCMKLKQSRIPIHKSAALENLFLSQVKKIKSVTVSLHEDLQADYLRELDTILVG